MSVLYYMYFDLVSRMFQILPLPAQNNIISSVWYMAEKYGVDKKHASYVEKMSISLFDKTWNYHKLGD